MTEATAKRRGWFRPLYLLSVAVLLVLIAHAHLVYVAVATQPDCVPPSQREGWFRRVLTGPPNRHVDVRRSRWLLEKTRPF